IPSTARNTHVQSKENSPLVSHPQAYSPTLSSNYIPPPSPTPSQLHAYPMPEGHQQYQHVYQNPYQQTHQQTYQQTYQHQPYPEPTLHAYPAPALVDTVDEKIDQASFVTKPGSNSRRKKIIWIGSVVILILIGAIIGIVISKNKGSDNNGGNSSDNSISGSSSSKPSTTPTPTTSRNPVSLVPVTVSSTPVTVLSTPVTVSSAPVISPKPTPSPPDSGSGGSGRYDAPPLPSLPPKGQCPFTFCGDYYSECRFSICVNDSDYKSCMANCTMLALVDTPTNTNTPGSSSDALVQSQSQPTSSKAPQEANYQLDDDSRASALVASSPQHITDGYTAPSTYTTDSPYKIPSTARSPHVQSTEYSPSASHPQAYSPALSSNYIPPPSPTPSQFHVYPVPEAQYQQNMYQDPSQQTYQQTYQQAYQHQPYPEPTLHSYPESAPVDTVDEKIDQASFVTKPGSNSRRKKIIWIGSVVILILIGAIIGIVISKNKGSDNNGGNSSDNSISGSSSSKPSTTPTPTTSRNPVSLVPVTVSTTPATVPSTPVTISFAPVTIPTPTSGGGSGGSGAINPSPPTLPPQYNCPTFFCDDWVRDCRKNTCGQDSDFKACTSKCNGEFFCMANCESNNPCQKQCTSIWSNCRSHCDHPLTIRK
ncbi:hypothetical protein BGZ47_002056, partial [Haplosporangium gracile]